MTVSEGYAAPPPPAPAARVRPTTVTLAGLMILLFLVAALVYLGASIAVLGPTTDAFNEAFAGTDFENSGGLFAATTLVGGIGYLLLAVTLGILTIFNNQGRNGTRIATWVIGGIGLCCGGLSLLSSAVSGMGTTGMPQDSTMPDPEELERILAEHLPGWYEPVVIVSNVGGVLLLAAALILLALPASNQFFRTPAPPATGPEPGYPPSPGLPPVG